MSENRYKIQTICWSLTIILAFSAGLAIYNLYTEYKRHNYLQDKLIAQRERLTDLKFWFKEHQKRAQKIDNWNQFWRHLQETGLKPERWEEYPFKINSKLKEKEIKQLLYLLGTQQAQAQQTWFKPENFEIVSSSQKSSSANSTNTKIAPEFYLRFSGEFLKNNEK